MKNPRPICPNSSCVNHQTPPASFYRKKGYRRAKHSKQLIPRYQCKTCGKYFCATQTKPTRWHHKPELNKQVFKLAVSGVTMSRMAILLECSPTTIARKIDHLAHWARKHHQEHIKSIATSHVMVDELETFLHSRYKQLSVVVAIRPKTGEVLGFAVAKKPSNQEMGHKKYGWHVDERPQKFKQVISGIAPLLKPNPTITTDSHTSYSKWLGQVLNPPYVHSKNKSPIGPGYDPLFAVNVAFAKMRNDLARLARKTWTTTKTIKALENHLWLWVAWTNGYELR